MKKIMAGLIGGVFFTGLFLTSASARNDDYVPVVSVSVPAVRVSVPVVSVPVPAVRVPVPVVSVPVPAVRSSPPVRFYYDPPSRY